jgi:hypothetical protein
VHLANVRRANFRTIATRVYSVHVVELYEDNLGCKICPFCKISNRGAAPKNHKMWYIFGATLFTKREKAKKQVLLPNGKFIGFVLRG